MLKSTRYTSKRGRQRKRNRQTSTLISSKCNQTTLWERACCIFPPTFWKIKSETTKGLSVCIINAFRVKSVAKSMPWIQIFSRMQEKYLWNHVHLFEPMNILVFMFLKLFMRLEFVSDFKQILFLSCQHVECSIFSCRWEMFSACSLSHRHSCSHLQSRCSCALLFPASQHTSPAPPFAHFLTISKLPVKWICIGFAVNPFTRQNDNEEKVVKKSNCSCVKLLLSTHNEMPF